jgi:protein-tyrosine kinase
MNVADRETATTVDPVNSFYEEARGHTGSLRVNTRAGQLATPDEVREWVFPGADELFRGIYTRAGTGFGSESLAICSSITGEGKTTLCVGLAITLAQDFPERRVLLVETDFQNPVLAEDFGVEATPGLIDCVFADTPVQDALRPTFLDNLHVLPVGGPVANGGRVLRSIRMAAALDAMRQAYDLIILDVPPILVNSDAVLLTDLADSIICVVRAGVTPSDMINKAIAQLDPEKLRGIVLNGSETAVPSWLRRLWGV